MTCTICKQHFLLGFGMGVRTILSLPLPLELYGPFLSKAVTSTIPGPVKCLYVKI